MRTVGGVWYRNFPGFESKHVPSKESLRSLTRTRQGTSVSLRGGPATYTLCPRYCTGSTGPRGLDSGSGEGGCTEPSEKMLCGILILFLQTDSKILP